MRNLTPAAGSHQITIAPTYDRFVDVHSTLNDPPSADLVETSSLAVTSLAPENAGLKAELLPTKMLEVPSSYGPLDALEIAPPGFDAAKKYPVVVYSSPSSHRRHTRGRQPPGFLAFRGGDE